MKSKALATEDRCGECGETVPFNVKECVGCGRYLGYPNVRKANEAKETAALQARYDIAVRSAKVGNFYQELVDFGNHVANKSHAVIARNLNALEAFVCSDNQLLISFYKMVQSGSRIPEKNAWDLGRESADSLVNPLIKDEIQYAALSLSSQGVEGYGDYFLTLKDIMINERASVFEENPYIFCDRHGVNGGNLPPPGYRCTWSNRGKLAEAKLFPKLHAGLSRDEYPGILLRNGPVVAQRDFVEVHIYGPLSTSAIQNVYGPTLHSGPERHVWRRVKRRLAELGVPVEEY